MSSLEQIHVNDPSLLLWWIFAGEALEQLLWRRHSTRRSGTSWKQLCVLKFYLLCLAVFDPTSDQNSCLPISFRTNGQTSLISQWAQSRLGRWRQFLKGWAMRWVEDKEATCCTTAKASTLITLRILGNLYFANSWTFTCICPWTRAWPFKLNILKIQGKRETMSR